MGFVLRHNFFLEGCSRVVAVVSLFRDNVVTEAVDDLESHLISVHFSY